ncbi:MAG: lipid IV(A) 3-deoxy-D-manno-octulosonic acid transferase [Pseudomonadota bacterium]
MRLIYSVLVTALVPLVMARMLWRSRRAPAYRERLLERLGYFKTPAEADTSIWVHAVSLGETLAARPLIEKLLDDFPQYSIVVTTTTPTGSEQVEKLFGDRVFHVYAPWDTPGAVKRFLRKTRPALLILMETELWPNMLSYSSRAGCRVMLANARLSARSAAGYARFARLTRSILASIDNIVAQSTADADRFLQLGMDPGKINVTGSIKFDITVSDELRATASRLKAEGVGDRRVLIVASTHVGEDQLALTLFAQLKKADPSLLMLLAPRHPERFNEVATLCAQSGFHLQRKSVEPVPSETADIWLIDTLGELLLLFGIADLAVIGGSFVNRGGHNPLEATVWGVPVLVGPYMFNFADVAVKLQNVGALESCEDLDQLLASASSLLADEQELARRKVAALEAMAKNHGALGALIGEVERLLGPGG